MNIENVKIDYSKLVGQIPIQVIFKKQRELMDLYKIPQIDLDIPKDQQLIRAMAWSVVEEAGEAIEVVEGSKHHQHLLDEVADMTHFYIEFLIMSGITWEDFANEVGDQNYEAEDYTVMFKEFIVLLSLSVNVLKNRFWRETNLKTDRVKYIEMVKKTMIKFVRFIASLNLTGSDLYDAYLRKNEVNLFRIRSKY